MSDILFFQKYFNKSCLKNKRTRYIWWFNIGIESLWNEGKNSIFPQLTNKGNLHTVNRTEQLCLLLASSDDIVIQREKPDPIICENLRNIGISIPEIWIPQRFENDEQYPISELILRDENLINKIRQLRSERNNDEIALAPYAITHLEEEISRITGCDLIGTSNDTVAWINSKVNSRLLAEELGLPVTEGYICNNIDDLEESIRNLANKYNCKIAVKEAYGASGKGIFIIDNDKSMQFLLNMVKRKSCNGFFQDLIVERWYDTAFDINYQIFVTDSGNIGYICPKKQIIREGLYAGSEFPISHYLTNEQNIFYQESAMKIGKRLWQKGYRGLASIDSIISADGEIFPVIEINGRFTLSTYVSFIPDLLGRDKIYISKYYNLKAGVGLSNIWEEIKQYRYSAENGEGIIIYSFAAGIQGFSNGRMFTLLVSGDREKINFFEQVTDNVITKIGLG